MRLISIRNLFFRLRLKLFYKNVVIGTNTIIDFKTKIHTGKNSLILGNNVYIRSIPRGYHAGMPFPTTFLIDRNNAFIKIGDSANLNGVYVHAQKGITIGNNTLIAAGVNLIDSNGHALNSFDRSNKRDEPAEIFIGSNVWIGLNAIILKGSTIGDNCVVGAGSVVRGQFPANSLILGNPASIVAKINLQ